MTNAELTIAKAIRMLNPVQCKRRSNCHLANSNDVLWVSSSRRDIFDLDVKLLRAGRLRLVANIGSLHDLHIGPDG